MTLLLLLNPRQSGGTPSISTHRPGGYFPAVYDHGEHKPKRKRKRKKAYQVLGPTTESAEAVEFKSASLDGFVTELARSKDKRERDEADDLEDLLKLLDLL